MREGSGGMVNGISPTMVLHVPKLDGSNLLENTYTSSINITPLDPVLRACISTTNAVIGSTIAATVTGNNTALTTQFVLVDANGVIVVGPQAIGSFVAPATAGIYKIVAVNYSGTVTGLTIGQNISSITGSCWELSAPKCFNVQTSSCSVTATVNLGNALTATISGNNTSAGYTTEYVLTDGNDVIVQGPSATASFTPTATGSYKIYAINYSGTVSGLSTGTNFISGVTGSCVAKSASKCFTVVCWTITNTVAGNTNPSTCGGNNGSIKICGLNANGTGYTINYMKNGTAATALSNQVADASGCLTIPNLTAGSYTNIIVSSTGCTGTNAVSASLSDPSAPSAPSGLSATPSTTCTGSSVALSASGVSGATYTWTVSPTGASLTTTAGTVTGTTAGNTLNTTAPGTYTVSITQMVAGCSSPAATTVVTVNGSATAPVIVGSGSLSNTCPTPTADLTTKQPASQPLYSYEWHTVSSNPSSTTLVTNPTSVVAGTYYLYTKSTTGGCYSPASSPVVVTITSCACSVTATVNLGNALTATISGNNTSAGYTTEYVLTDGNDVIVQGPSATASFTPTATGSYKIYAINYSGTVSGLSTGTNFISGVTGSCVAKSASKCFTVVCWTITNTVAGNTNPSTCGGNNGSIKICGLNANGTGYTINYMKNGTAATALSNQVADASGCLTIPNLTAGSYTNIIVSSTGCTGTNAVSASLSDPSAPSAPSGLSATPSTTCTGSSVALSASGVSGATYTWTVSPTGASLTTTAGTVTGTTAGNTLNTTAPGTYTVSITQMVAGCSSPAATTVVTVNGSATAPVIVGSGSLSNTCPTPTADLTTKQPASQPLYSYEWHTVSSNPSSTTLVTNPTSVVAGTYYLYTKSTTGGCYSPASNPVTVTIGVCCPTIAQGNVTPNNPSACGGSNGSIKICGFTASGTGYTINYMKNGTAATALSNQVADASGCLTIPNLTAGSYTNIIVSSTGCTGTNAVSASLSDPSAPSAPSGLSATSGNVCTGESTTLLGNCASGTIVWYDNSGLTGSPLASNVVSPTVNTTYYAICVNNACKSTPTSISVTVGGPACKDTDGDGLKDTVDLDDDNDGILDSVELAGAPANGDTDGDGIIDSLDLDSDNDGINDVREAGGTDANGDGMADGTPNSQGIPSSAGTSGLTPVDTDGDGQKDFQDLDSDNDTISDLKEGGSNGTDTNNDGVIDLVDADKDGIQDSVDGNVTGFGDLNDPLPIEQAADADNIPDYRDVDSNGTTKDIVLNGNGSLDANGDGKVDNPTDPDKDGVANNNGLDTNPTVFGGLGNTTITTAKLNAKVLLQGALFGTTGTIMRDDLRAAGVIPTNQPYSTLGTTYPRLAHTGTETIGSGVLSVIGNDAIVDWVLVELRDANNPATIVKTRAALVQKDGDIVEASDGVSPLSFTGDAGKSYYVAVKHRNHLGAMTTTAIPLTTAGTTVDFTSMTSAQLYNSTATYEGYEQVDVNGKKALWAGNTNADTKVKYSGLDNDLVKIFNEALTYSGNTSNLYNYDFATPGYFMGDVDMNAKVKYSGLDNDTVLIFVNVLNKYSGLNASKLYNYDLFIEQIP